jgi:hypothetical protein
MATLTWSQLRHSLARRLGDHTAGTATGGAATTLLDAAQRKERDNFWLGADLKVYSGTGSPQSRMVSASTQATGTLTHAGSNWTVPDATSLYELHRLFPASEYDELLKESLRWHTRSRRLYDRKSDVTLTWVTDQWDYSIPAGFVAISTVELSTETGTPDTDEYEFIKNDAWYVRQTTTRKLVFNKSFAQPTVGTLIRVTGYAEFADPTADTTTYNLDANPIVQLALVFATEALLGMAPSAHFKELHQYAIAEHDRMLQRIPDPAFTDAKIVESL